MSKGERPSVPARYEAGRDKDGQFLPGHSIGAKNRGLEVNKKLSALRELWYDCNSIDDMSQVKNELLTLISSCPVWDVKLKAIVYYCDRMLGKPLERVEMEVGPAPARTLPDLTPEEMAVMERVIQRVESSPDPEVVVEPDESAS